MRLLIIVDNFTSCAAIAAYLSARKIVNYSFVSIDEASDWIDNEMFYKILIQYSSAEDLAKKKSKLEFINVDCAVLCFENCEENFSIPCFGENTTKDQLENWLEKNETVKSYQRSLMIKIREAYKKVNKNEILFIKSDGKYISVRIGDRSYSLRTSLKNFYAILPSDFIRIHASHIINLSKVDAIDLSKQEVLVNGHKIPFSRQYKSGLLKNFDLY